MIHARSSDLERIEFAAFNHGRSLPHMRRWELPFALAEARLRPGMRVLDLSINPAGFGDRVLDLHPTVTYRWWPPHPGEPFRPPPRSLAADCDRVVCVNTLEHLTAPARAALFAAASERLRPGGRLIITCDHYFPGSWSDPVWLNSGMIRADGGEVAGGCNPVPATELHALATAHGLAPLHPLIADPDPRDAGLHLAPAPFAHACTGHVFGKAPTGVAADEGLAIGLGMLCWNTRVPTREAVWAMVREAGMLRRLGHRPFVCVCDNGSSDGTTDDLRAMAEAVDVPHDFLFNDTNRGNCIARNQLIDRLMEAGSDYILLTDGDLEIVPHSSLAMAHAMEAMGPEVGCLGVASSWQSPERERTTPVQFHIPAARINEERLVAWTQYGLFSRDVFDSGVRFEARPPYDGPGWGWEDNDLAFQMIRNGFGIRSFTGMTYLHRAQQSSVRNMELDGIPWRDIHAARARLLVAKWQDDPTVATELADLAAGYSCTAPVRT